jgi:hypothetical protein
VRIGNSFRADRPLAGALDEIKVWRPDPDAMYRQFLSRPIDPDTADCWAEFFASLGRAARLHPDCAELVAAQVEAVLERVLRAIAAGGEAAQRRHAELTAMYARLWAAGRIDGRAMADVFRRWWALLNEVGIDLESDRDLEDIARSECLKLLITECVPPECDSQAVALLRLITDARPR